MTTRFGKISTEWTVPALEIFQIQVLMTMVGGKIVFERKEQ